MVVEARFTHVLKRGRRGEEPFDRNKTLKAILSSAKEIEGFQRHILPSEIFGNDIMLDFRNRTDEEIASSLTDKVTTTLNYLNSLALGVESLSKHPNQFYMPAVEDMQDIIINLLWDYGFIDIAETYLYFRSLKSYMRNGEIKKEQMPFHGYPSEEFKKGLEDLYNKNNCDSAEKINDALAEGKPFLDLIEIFTDRYNSSLKNAFELFKEKSKQNDISLIIIAGKSSSGKTTTTHKFCDMLHKEGIKTLNFQVDNYFKSIQPTSPRGEKNYELPESLDLVKLKRDLDGILLDRKKVEVPIYDFSKEKRVDNSGKFVKLDKGRVLVIDSHQGLYPIIRNIVPDENKFAIYLEPFNQISSESNSDNPIILRHVYNMLRRLSRGLKRTQSLEYNLPHWQLVRIGELRDIVPRMNLADVQIDSGLSFELNYMSLFYSSHHLPKPETFLKKGMLYGAIRSWQAEELLKRFNPVPESHMDKKVLPPESVLREFIGGSCYDTI